MLLQVERLLVLEHMDTHLKPLNPALISSIVLTDRDPAEEESQGEREEVSQLSAELSLDISSRLIMRRFQLQEASALPKYDSGKE